MSRQSHSENGIIHVPSKYSKPFDDRTVSPNRKGSPCLRTSTLAATPPSSIAGNPELAAGQGRRGQSGAHSSLIDIGKETGVLTRARRPATSPRASYISY